MFGAISRAESVEDLVAIIEGGAPLSSACACHAVYWLGRLLQQRQQPLPDGLDCALSKAAGLLRVRDGELTGRDISKAAWGLAKASVLAGVHTHACRGLEALGERGAAASSSLDPAAVASLLHACGTVGVPLQPAVFRVLQARAAALAAEPESAFKSQDLANMLWGWAKLNATPDAAAMSALGSRLVAELPSFRPMELSTTAWALAKFDPPPAELPRLMLAIHQALGADAVAELPTGKGGKGKGGKGKGGDDKGGEGGRLAQLSPQGAANCLWAFARSEPPPPPQLLHRLLAHAAAQASGLSSQGIANVCSACARLDGGLTLPLRLLGDRSALAALGSQDVAEVAWALGKLARGLERAVAPPALASVVGAVLQRSTQVAAGLDWRGVGHVEFLLRSVSALGGHPLRQAESASASLLPVLHSAAFASLGIVAQRRTDMDDSAAGCLLQMQPLPWEGLSPRAEVLVVGAGSGAAALTAALAASGLRWRTWQRFCVEGTDPASACAPPPADAAAGYAAALLRLPPTRAAFDLAVHAVGGCMREGALLFTFGCRAEGIHAVPGRLHPLFGGASHCSSSLTAPTPRGPVDAAPVQAAVVRAARTAQRARSGLKEWEERGELDLAEVGLAVAPLPWVTLPGLFAAGGLDVMTAVLLRALPPPPPAARILDHCCGAGSIAAALRASPGARLGPRTLGTARLEPLTTPALRLSLPLTA